MILYILIGVAAFAAGVGARSLFCIRHDGVFYVDLTDSRVDRYKLELKRLDNVAKKKRLRLNVRVQK